MRYISRLLAIVGIIGAVTVIPAQVSAVTVFDNCSGANQDTAVCKSTGDSATNMITIIINTLLTVLGMISVIMIVIGGIRYTTANGDPGTLKTARETIIYSVVGLIVAMLAFAIVNFVVTSFIPPKTK